VSGERVIAQLVAEKLLFHLSNHFTIPETGGYNTIKSILENYRIYFFAGQASRYLKRSKAQFAQSLQSRSSNISWN